MDKEYLDRIVKECSVFDENNIGSAVKKIQELDERFERDNLVQIYNELLLTVHNP